MKSDNLMTPTQILIAHLIEYADNQQVIKWANDFFQIHPNDECYTLIEIISINCNIKDELSKVGGYLQSYIDFHYPDFNPSDKQSEIYAKFLFKQRLIDYQQETCNPYDIQKMIGSIEWLYDYPVWLGNM